MIVADSYEVRAVEMTDHRHGDGEIVPGLLAQLHSRGGSALSAATVPTIPVASIRPPQHAAPP